MTSTRMRFNDTAVDESQLRWDLIGALSIDEESL
jgi:hypothetical protein